ncbi:MAG: hypothetical protein J6R99_02875 [Alphaproteobacteria bacterium]|nr:hypothetical protein [Alphaproteobacteria bacterium]MBO7066572.1 hypothetical protein [Alphaproteobacteria bacterium]
MTRLGTIGWPDQDRRVIRSSAFVASKWAAENPILQLGEVGYETDTNKLKVGDGVTKWNSLPYAGDGGGSSLPDQDGHSGEFLTTDGTDASWGAVDALPDTTGASEGDVLALDSNGDPAWTTPSGGGLPDQTGQSGKFLTTDGTDASWSDKPLVNNATGTAFAGNPGIGICDAGSTLAVLDGVGIGNGVLVEKSNTSLKGRSVAIGNYAQAAQSGQGGDVAFGYNAWGNGGFSVAIGHTARTSASHAIQIGCTSTSVTNSDANTFKVANANGNYEIMSADGTIPAARHASLPAADGTYVLKLVIASGVPTLSWVAE